MALFIRALRVLVTVKVRIVIAAMRTHLLVLLMDEISLYGIFISTGPMMDTAMGCLISLKAQL